MFNVRYHIASLVAVFLALALGLVLGGLVVQRGTLDGQQEALVDGLRDEFDTLRSENAALEAENDLLGAFTTDAVGEWIDGRLQGRTVVVLVNAGREDGMRPATDAIEAAGGQAATVTMLQPGFGLDDEAIRSRVESLTGGVDDPLPSLAASLAAEWATPVTDRPVTDLLVDAGVLSLDEFPEQGAIAGVVDIASPEGESDPAAVQLAVAIHELGLPAIGAQTAGTDTGKAASASDEGLAGLDGLGGEVGRYSLIALLTGAEPGFFGTLPAAQAPYPPLTSAP